MQRDVLRELVQLVRYAEPDGRNIGFFVAEHASELAQLLQSDETELRAAAHESDGALVDRLRVRLELALERDRQLHAEQLVERSHRAAQELGRTARWFELGVMLDVDVVLGDLLADPRVKHVAFRLGEVTALVPTNMLRRTRQLRHVYIDLACYVDEHGVHIRWKGGRGQLNFFALEPTVHIERDALVVDLPPQRERRPVLVGDVLAELGFGV